MRIKISNRGLDGDCGKQCAAESGEVEDTPSEARLQK